MAGRQGFEPRYADPESAVLPLDDLPTCLLILANSPSKIISQAAPGAAKRLVKPLQYRSMPDTAHPSIRAARRSLNWSSDLEQHKGWYHSIELPGGQVIEGVHSIERLRKRWSEFPIPAGLTGKRGLDIGAWDGWFSFEMERRGAEVVAVDCVEIPNFVYAHDKLGSRVDYRILDMYELSPATLGGYFEVVLFLGVLYHLKHPLLALEIVCGLTKDVCIIDSWVVPKDERAGTGEDSIPYLEFYETDELGEQLDNWFGPTLECLLGMCRAAGFARTQVLRVDTQRAVVACFRRWEPAPDQPTSATPVLTCAAHSRNWGINFRNGADEYLTCWFRSPETELTRFDVFPEISGYGIAPMHLRTLEDGTWQVNFRLPPGLPKGWHDVRVRTAASALSNPLRIAVDLPLDIDSLSVAAVCDANTWARLEVPAGGFVAFWIKGLPGNCDRNNIRVSLGGVRLPVDHIAEPDVNGYRQVNAAVPESMPPEERDFVVRCGNAASDPVKVRVR
jgi:tRNA (mo5U34)-methyltransferase